MSEEKIDLGVKFGSKREQRLLKVQEVCEETILDNEIDSMIKKCVLELLAREISKERAKLK